MERKLVRKVQEFLNENGFECGAVDGIAGSKTLKAVDNLKTALRVKRASVASKSKSEKNMPSEQREEANEKGLRAERARREIREACEQEGFDRNQTAYVLATVDHETGGTFLPVREAYYISDSFDVAERWRKKHLRYWPFYGRSYSQLTWKENYEKYSKILSDKFGKEIDLVKNPDLALKPEYAVAILVDGFKYGRFTGKKISDYINDNQVDFRNARRCINGLDEAARIARLAHKYL